jgi:hypothetical protein
MKLNYRLTGLVALFLGLITLSYAIDPTSSPTPSYDVPLPPGYVPLPQPNYSIPPINEVTVEFIGIGSVPNPPGITSMEWGTPEDAATQGLTKAKSVLLLAAANSVNAQITSWNNSHPQYNSLPEVTVNNGWVYISDSEANAIFGPNIKPVFYLTGKNYTATYWGSRTIKVRYTTTLINY